MAVIAEAISVIIKDSSIKTHLIGGIDAFRRSIPNSTYCSDNEIHRVGFMAPDDTKKYVSLLEKNGLTFLQNGGFQDIAVVDMLIGPTMGCSWLGFVRSKLFEGSIEFKNADKDFSVTWLLPKIGVYGIPLDADREFKISVPEGWTPDKAIYGDNFIPLEKLKSRLIELGNEDGLIKFLDANGGKLVYHGNPKIVDQKFK